MTKKKNYHEWVESETKFILDNQRMNGKQLKKNEIFRRSDLSANAIEAKRKSLIDRIKYTNRTEWSSAEIDKMLESYDPTRGKFKLDLLEYQDMFNRTYKDVTAMQNIIRHGKKIKRKPKPNANVTPVVRVTQVVDGISSTGILSSEVLEKIEKVKHRDIKVKISAIVSNISVLGSNVLKLIEVDKMIGDL